MEAAAIILSILPGVVMGVLGSRIGLPALAVATVTEALCLLAVRRLPHRNRQDLCIWIMAVGVCAATAAAVILRPEGMLEELDLAAAAISAVLHMVLLLTISGFILNKR